MRINGIRALNPGRLIHQGIWERMETRGQTTFGEDIREAVIVATVNAEVVALQGRELQAAQQRWAEARYVIKHHYVSGILRTDRFRWTQRDGSTKYLDPLDIQDEGGVGLVLIAFAKEWAA